MRKGRRLAFAWCSLFCDANQSSFRRRVVIAAIIAQAVGLSLSPSWIRGAADQRASSSRQRLLRRLHQHQSPACAISRLRHLPLRHLRLRHLPMFAIAAGRTVSPLRTSSLVLAASRGAWSRPQLWVCRNEQYPARRAIDAQSAPFRRRVRGRPAGFFQVTGSLTQSISD